MAAIRHIVFLKVWFFEHLVRSGGLVCVIVQNVIIIGQTVLEISRFFDFQDGRHPPPWILKFLVFHQSGRTNMHLIADLLVICQWMIFFSKLVGIWQASPCLNIAMLNKWLSLFSDLNVSQVSIATHLRCGGILKWLYNKFTNEFISAKNLEIG